MLPILWIVLVPVSYTHLDVYKRQLHIHTPILCSKILLYILASTAGNDASEKNIVLFFSQCLVQFLGHCFLNFLIEIRVVKQFRKGVVVIKETLGHNIAELIREQRPHEHFGTVVLGIFSELLNLRVPHEHLIDPVSYTHL